jgi:hypothetical protein
MTNKHKKQRYYKVEYWNLAATKIGADMPFKNENELHKWFNAMNFSLLSVEYIGWR